MSHHDLLMAKAAELVGAPSADDLDITRNADDPTQFELRGPDGVARLYSPLGRSPRLEKAASTWRVNEHSDVVDGPTAASLLDSAAAHAQKASEALTAGDPRTAHKHAKAALGGTQAAWERLNSDG